VLSAKILEMAFEVLAQVNALEAEDLGKQAQVI
jgi:hypothetical protein